MKNQSGPRIVYVVFRGSNRSLAALFSTRRRAENYITTTKTGWIETYEVEADSAEEGEE